MAAKSSNVEQATYLAELEKELQFRMDHDDLTKLPNRTRLFECLRLAIANASQDSQSLAVIIFDLDRFKTINDSLTHAVGDKLLCEVAKRLQLAMREGDVLARIDGDEFVVVAMNVSDKNHVMAIANQILQIFQQPFSIANREVVITVSVGASLFPENGNTVDILLRNADAAVYHAKKNGANRLEFYTLDMNSQALAALDKEMELRHAILNNQFVLYYQPQFDTVTREMVGIEALIRWNHPVKGLLQPVEFIPLAEETGMTIAIGEWVLKTACKQAKKWQDAGFSPCRIAVNVTSAQIKQADLVKTVSNILKETKLNPTYLELEISENIVISTSDVINIISALKSMGIEITLDDFGMGYSSLSYLKKLKLNRLKIDKAFVQPLPGNRDDNLLVRAIIAIGKAFDLVVLAEGVETQEQFDFLKAERCQEIQGFYFSEPLPAEEFEKTFSSRPSQV